MGGHAGIHVQALARVGPATDILRLPNIWRTVPLLTHPGTHDCRRTIVMPGHTAKPTTEEKGERRRCIPHVHTRIRVKYVTMSNAMHNYHLFHYRSRQPQAHRSSCDAVALRTLGRWTMHISSCGWRTRSSEQRNSATLPRRQWRGVIDIDIDNDIDGNCVHRDP